MAHCAETINLNNWQQHLKTWPERISHIKQNDKFTDFCFIVGPGKLIFHAHKLIFATSSPEFENLFYLLESDMKEIVLPETSTGIFKDFINYIYTGKLNLTLENVAGILKLSKLYSITLLAKKCDSFLEENVVKENVLNFLDVSSAYELVEAIAECLKIIDENSAEIFESFEFLEISKNSLQKIVECEMMSCEEIQIFQAVDRWSEYACTRNRMEQTSENKRSAIGDTILKIRFSGMSMKEFVKCSDENTLLTNNEIVTILRSISKASKSELRLKKRIGQLPVKRFIRFVRGPSNTRAFSIGGKTKIDISVNKNDFLCGIGVYGRAPEALVNYGKAKITIRLQDDTNRILAKRSKGITFDGTKKIYEIFFKVPVPMEQCKIYKITVDTDGPNEIFQNFSGINGKTSIEENGTKINLSRSSSFPIVSHELDSLTSGTIASFIFRS